MNEMNQEKQRTRFFREATPYFDDFELVVSQLLGKEKIHGQYVSITVEMLRGIYDQLADCHSILGKTEKLVEEARARNESSEEIEKLVLICRDLQNLQTNLANTIMNYINKVVDEVFPR